MTPAYPDRVWLAVPYFDGTRLRGMPRGRPVSMRRAVDVLLPPWFLESQTVRLVVDDAAPPRRRHTGPWAPYRAVMNLPDTDLMLEVVPQGPAEARPCRIFFVIIGAAVSCWACWPAWRRCG